MSTATPAPKCDGAILSYPAPHILLMTIDREKQMNSVPNALHWQMHHVFKWFDEEPTLRVAVITGAGKKAFCAGQDLIEMGGGSGPITVATHPATGFAGISRRSGRKPIIAAVNGFALGGGFEIVLNCDMVVASPQAKFGLPEASRGLYAGAGGLHRVVKNCGMPVASEIAMTSRVLSAEEALRYNLINKIAQTHASVVDEAVEMAQKVASFSPDSIVVTRAGLRETWETASVERACQLVENRYRDNLYKTDNTREGLTAFAQKRAPIWKPSKL